MNHFQAFPPRSFLSIIPPALKANKSQVFEGRVISETTRLNIVARKMMVWRLIMLVSALPAVASFALGGKIDGPGKPKVANAAKPADIESGAVCKRMDDADQANIASPFQLGRCTMPRHTALTRDRRLYPFMRPRLRAGATRLMATLSNGTSALSRRRWTRRLTACSPPSGWASRRALGCARTLSSRMTS